MDHTCVDEITHDPKWPILHGCGFAWEARFGPRMWPRQEEEGDEMESKIDVLITGILDHQPSCQSE